MSDFEKTFMGTGWAFPPTFHKEKKGVSMVSDVEDINQSLHILLSTSIKERVMQPKYGCDLQSFLFEPVNLTLLTYMKSVVKDAIVKCEPRVTLLDLVLDTRPEEGLIEITVRYEVRGTNSRFNYVYPYYLEEGTEITS